MSATHAVDSAAHGGNSILKGRIALVNGAGGSIGGVVARIFAREGARLFLAGRTLAKVEAVARDIRACGGEATAAEVDALDETAVEAHVRAVAAEAGGIDILFNAIGMEDIQGAPLTDMPFDDFFRPIRKAAKSQFLTARAVGRHMAKSGAGVMLTVTAGPPDATADIGHDGIGQGQRPDRNLHPCHLRFTRRLGTTPMSKPATASFPEGMHTLTPRPVRRENRCVRCCASATRL